MIRTRVLLALSIGAALGACRPTGDDQETGSISREDVVEARRELSPEVTAALDSGNILYRAKDYAAAREQYAAAAQAGEDVAAAWFGLYMAELALGNTEAAEAAMDRAQDLAPGASLIHQTPTDSTP